MNFYDEHTPTWRGRYDEEVILYRSDTDAVIMTGTITRVIGGNPLSITVSGTLIKMSWYGMGEAGTRSKMDSFVVAEDPDTYGLEYNGSGTWTNSGANTDIHFNGRLSDYQLDDNADYVDMADYGYTTIYMAIAVTAARSARFEFGENPRQ